MDRELRILILEDVATDAKLEEKELQRAGIIFTSKVVKTRDDFIRGLEEFMPDIILADYSLPDFDGMTALNIAVEKFPDVPFIFVTGVMGEELAVDTLKRGATDYVLKTKLFKLAPAVQRALEMAAERSRLREAEEKLRESEERYRNLIEFSPDAILVHSDGKIVFINNAGVRLFGAENREQLIGKPAIDVVHPDYREIVRGRMRMVLEEGEKAPNIEKKIIRLDGTSFDTESTAMPFTYQSMPAVLVIIRDITERKKAEEALKESEEKYRGVVDNIAIGVSLISPNMEILALNNQMRKWFPYVDVLKKPICYKTFNVPSREDICSYCPTYKTLKDGEVHEAITDTPSGEKIINYRILSSAIKNKEGKIVAAIEMVEDITERKKAEDKIKEQLNYLERFQRSTVQREFRMKELRDENEALKRKINELEKKG